MKKPVVSYKNFRLSKLNTPEFSHLKLLLSWIVYFIFYYLTENFIPVEKCHPMHCWLDDVIPFNEFFFIPYTFWFVLIIISLLYFLLYDVDSFKKLQTYIIITQIVAMTVYIVYPSRQDLRPDTFERDNFFTHLAAFIYAFDTSTGVCPSLHVAYSMGMASVWTKAKGVSKYWKAFVVFSAVIISAATMFVKQHSAVDVFAAIPVGLLAEFIVFRKVYKEKFKKGKALEKH
ncbi:MAG: phosphatidic acid phosphatase [Candidatus Limivicinus sp.]